MHRLIFEAENEVTSYCVYLLAKNVGLICLYSLIHHEK